MVDAEIGKAKHLPSRRCRVGTTKETAYGCYVIADMKITNPNQFPEFIEVTPATVQRYGGKYLIRGGSFEVTQGERTPGRLAVIEFAGMDQARA